MTEEKKDEKLKIHTERPVGQKREYSNYVEISANPRDVSLKFCDLKPPVTKDEANEIIKNGTTLIVNTEIVLPFDVAESLIEALKKQIDTVKEKMKEETK